MLVTRQEKFRPISITLDSEEEVRCLWHALRTIVEGGDTNAYYEVPDKYRGLWYTGPANRQRLIHMFSGLDRALREER